MTRCWIFDIDGTVADSRRFNHLLETTPKDWNKFYEHILEFDPIQHTIEIAQWADEAWDVVAFSTGRTEMWRKPTELWLYKQGIPGDEVLMRPDNDFCPAQELKLRHLKYLQEKYHIMMAFEDHEGVAKMYRENGVPCAVVAERSYGS